MAYFQNAAAGYYQTPNASRGEDPGAEAGWTLGHPYGSRFVRPLGFGGDSWNFRPGDSRRIPLNVYGWPNPLPAAPNPAPPPHGPVLVSTLGQPSTSTGQLVGKRINLEIAYAASFTNGNDAVHTLHGVQIEVTFIPPPLGKGPGTETIKFFQEAMTPQEFIRMHRDERENTLALRELLKDG